LPQVPELQSLIPAAGHHTGVIGPDYVVDNLDGRIVLRNLNKLIGLQIPHFGCFVAAGGEDLAAVVAPAAAENGRVHLLDRLGDGLATGVDLPAADVVGP